MIHFSLFGIPVRVQPLFWLTMALIGGAFGARTSTEIFQLCLFMIAGFISILVHELGHALTINAFGVRTSITLQAFGGYASHPGGILSRKQSFLVTAAGPAIQLILAGLAYGAMIYLPQKPELAHGFYFLSQLFIVSLFWALLNLLPVLPLDGGQLVNALLGPQRIRTTLWITIICGVAGALALFYLQYSMFPILLGIFAFQAFQALKEIRRY